MPFKFTISKTVLNMMVGLVNRPNGTTCQHTDIPTAFAAVYQHYLCIFLISETDMIAARFMEVDSLLNPPYIH